MVFNDYQKYFYTTVNVVVFICCCCCFVSFFFFRFGFYWLMCILFVFLFICSTIFVLSLSACYMHDWNHSDSKYKYRIQATKRKVYTTIKTTTTTILNTMIWRKKEVQKTKKYQSITKHNYTINLHCRTGYIRLNYKFNLTIFFLLFISFKETEKNGKKAIEQEK